MVIAQNQHIRRYSAPGRDVVIQIYRGDQQRCGRPIFKVADYGIVGDLFEVVPKMLEDLG